MCNILPLDKLLSPEPIRCQRTDILDGRTRRPRRLHEKNYVKGIDFLEQSRYNVELYENNEKGDAPNAQH